MRAVSLGGEEGVGEGEKGRHEKTCRKVMEGAGGLAKVNEGRQRAIARTYDDDACDTCAMLKGVMARAYGADLLAHVVVVEYRPMICITPLHFRQQWKRRHPPCWRSADGDTHHISRETLIRGDGMADCSS